MKFTIFTIYLIALSLIEAENKQEQEVLSFDSLMHKVLLNSTQAAEIKLSNAQAKADVIAATTLDNPSLIIDKTAKHRKASNEWLVEFEQPLRWSQFGAAQNYAQLLESTSSLEEKAQLLSLRHSVLRAYMECWLKQEQCLILQEQLSLIEQQQQALVKAESQGKVSRLEVEVLDINLMRMREQLRSLRLESDEANHEILHMAGLKKDGFIATQIELKPLPTLTQLTQSLNQGVGAKVLLTRQAELAQSRYNVIKKDTSLPQIAPRAVYEKDQDSGSSNFFLGVNITLPIWNRNQESLLRAHAQLEVTKTALKQVESGFWDVALSHHYQQAQEWRESHEVYQTVILSQWQSITNLIKNKFDNGQLSIADLADYQEQEVQLKTEALEAYVKAIEATIALETLTGKALKL